MQRKYAFRHECINVRTPRRWMFVHQRRDGNARINRWSSSNETTRELVLLLLLLPLRQYSVSLMHATVSECVRRATPIDIGPS